jgi:hypothetical protein
MVGISASPFRQTMQDRGLAGLAVPDQEAHIARRFRDFRSVAGEIQILLALRQSLERGHVVDHRSVRRRHDRGRPAHHVIADEKHFALRPGERQMIGGMARRRHRLQRPAEPSMVSPSRTAMSGLKSRSAPDSGLCFSLSKRGRDARCGPSA